MSATETKALVERLRELAEKATADTWYIVGYDDTHCLVDSDDDEHPIAETVEYRNAKLICELRNALPQILAALEPLTREPDADEVEREKQLDEAREEGFQEGYAEGQDDANHASKDTFHAVVAWLRKRDFLQPCDYPEGYTAEDIAEALNEHEENLVCLSKRAALTEEPGHGA